MATYSLNLTLAVNGPASAGYLVSSGSYAIATYTSPSGAGGPSTAYFGPGQTVTATIASGGTTWTFSSGIVFVNSP